MASFGKNMRITVDEKNRTALRRLFTEVLGCSVKNPSPELEVYGFEDGFGVGAFYVEGGRALAASDHMKAPWLEVLVTDPAATKQQLAMLGIEPFEYADKGHDYYQAPGGPVFRLAKR